MLLHAQVESVGDVDHMRVLQNVRTILNKLIAWQLGEGEFNQDIQHAVFVRISHYLAAFLGNHRFRSVPDTLDSV